MHFLCLEPRETDKNVLKFSKNWVLKFHFLLLGALHNVTDDDGQTDGRNSVPIARPLVRSANKTEIVGECQISQKGFKE